MSEVKRMYELLYEERWDEKKQKEYGRIRRGTIRRRWCIAFLNRSSDVL